MNLETLVAQLKRRCAGSNQKVVAAEMGISNNYLSVVLRGKLEPGPKILDALGLEKRVSYVEKKA